MNNKGEQAKYYSSLCVPLQFYWASAFCFGMANNQLEKKCISIFGD